MIRWEGGGTFVGRPEGATKTKGAGIARDGAVEITRAREMYTERIHLQNLQLREKEALGEEDNNNK